MRPGRSLSDVISERLIEVVRRVGESDYSKIDLGGASPESLDPELLARELAWHLFPVEGTAPQVKFQRSKDEVANQYAEGFEVGINVFAEAAYGEQWRFDNYGLVFGLGTFDSKRKGEKSSLWKPEISGELKFLNGDFDSLTVTAQYADAEVDRTDYMEFFENIGKRFTRLCIPYASGDWCATAISLEREHIGQFIKPYVDAAMRRELARLTMEGSIPIGMLPHFKDGTVRSVAFFHTEQPEDSGIFCVRSTAPKSLGDNSYRTLNVPRGNVAHLVLTELTSENLDITQRFLRNYCFVPNE